MSDPIPARPALTQLIHAAAHTAEADIILVRSSAQNPVSSCFRGQLIKPGGLGYQTRATISVEPWAGLLVPYVAPQPEPAPVQAQPEVVDAGLAAGSWAAPPPIPPTSTMTAREAVAFISQAGPGEYEHFRSDPRRSVKDAVEDRDHTHSMAGV
jgi:hypothetical protein